MPIFSQRWKRCATQNPAAVIVSEPKDRHPGPCFPPLLALIYTYQFCGGCLGPLVKEYYS